MSDDDLTDDPYTDKQARQDEKRRVRESRAGKRDQLKRTAKVAGRMGGFGARLAGKALLNVGGDHDVQAAALSKALGNLKGPLVKIAQMLATVPDVIGEDYAKELAKLQANAPPMGAAFVKRRMRTELGPDWRDRFDSFEIDAAAAASLGQVHRATIDGDRQVAVKLQYPDMMAAVEADLKQLKVILQVAKVIESTVDLSQIGQEVSDRLREELDYVREMKHMQLYGNIFAGHDDIHIPNPVPDLTTGRLLTMDWLDGHPLLHFADHPLEVRNDIAQRMMTTWWHPFVSTGVIHGDPHLGNYTIRDDLGINLLDYGCVRIFSPRFVTGVMDLYYGFLNNDMDLVADAYTRWGFDDLTKEMMEVMNLWAKFIFAPLLDDRVRSIADGVKPVEYGRKEAMTVRAELKKLGRLTVPKEFVFMDRAAIGLGAIYLHLGAEVNWHQVFMGTLENYAPDSLTARQAAALAQVDLTHPDL